MIEFHKWQHIGNDFIIVDCYGAPEKFKKTFTPARVQKLCHRHFGIGADGVIGVLPPGSTEFDYKMEIINSDGTLAAMCGNGLACFAKFVSDSMKSGGGKKGRTIKVQTRSGRRDASVSGRNVFLDMGLPNILEGKFTPAFFRDWPLRPLQMTLVSMGNPHCVMFLKDQPGDADFLKFGPAIENHELFPDRTNVEFVTLEENGDEKILNVKVWERGAGPTLACGTGASAVAAAAHKLGLCGNKVKIKLPGGFLTAEIKEDGRVILKCAPLPVYKGTID